MTRLLAPFILIVLLLGAWELACRVLGVPVYLLPTPSAIGVALAQGWPVLLASAWNTLSTALIGLAAASLTACGLALLVSLNPTLEDAVRPVAVTLQVTPLVAIGPLMTIWAGIEHPQRAVVALAAVAAFFPIFSGALTGLKAVDPDLARLFDLYGARRVQRLWRLRLPSAVPALLEGHKVAAGLAVVGAVVAEFVAGSGGSQGLAWRILESSTRLQTARVFAALAMLAILGVALHALMTLAERRLLAWWRGR
ncbi:ABC-type nitrate/sulfonate/bicarbonate transport system, permease component [Caulobacter sp. AP07]|uniref:ABC transporter permease n=1 Tax=Caulobacter sp. AP07 TaxID=1144304 RepID=UPI000271FCCD|nr:ABC transporter permease [Caulobacter sp. AP07]EJL27580.1 ABC-type nitrate/sulfonate/bicarbonate transport system, permease component [Caulobacter sp. AP07]